MASNAWPALEGTVESYLEDLSVLPGWIARNLELMRCLDARRDTILEALDERRATYLQEKSKQVEEAQKKGEVLKIMDDCQDEELQQILSMAQETQSLLREKIAIEDQCLHVMHHDYKRLKSHYAKLQGLQNGRAPEDEASTRLRESNRVSRSPYALQRLPSDRRISVEGNDKKCTSNTAPNRRASATENRPTSAGSAVGSNVSTSSRHRREERKDPSLQDIPDMRFRQSKASKKTSEVESEKMGSTVDSEVASFRVMASSGMKRNKPVGGEEGKDNTRFLYKTDSRQGKYPRKQDSDQLNTSPEITEDLLIPADNLSLYDKSKASEGDVCPSCQRGEVTGDDMVACDACQNWYHFSCAGYDPLSNIGDWFCSNCTSASCGTSGGTRVNNKVFKSKGARRR